MNGNTRPRPQIEAQVMELRSRFAAYSEKGNPRLRLGPGDLVVEKRGLGFIDLEVKDRIVWIFWRWLDPANPVDILIIQDAVKAQFVNDVNCIVGALSDNGASVVYRPHDSAQLEVYKP